MQKRCRKVIPFLLCSLFMEMSNASLSFQTNSDAADKKFTPTPTIETKKLTASATAPNFAIGKPAETLDEANIKATLKKYELILAQEKKVETLISLEFNRIICFIQLARIVRVKYGGKNLVKEEEEYLKKALKLIDIILKQPTITPVIISQLYFFQGTSYLDLGLKEKSRESFEKSVEINSDSKFIPSLGLYLADLYYDEGNLPKAQLAYKRFYNKMNPEEQNLADYKIAWISLNQSNIDLAVDIFLSLIQKSKAKSIVQDSVLSLSVALSEKYDQQTILDKIEKAPILLEHKVKVLSGVYENFLKQPHKERIKIWEKILKSETNEEEVLKLLSTEIQFMDLAEKKAQELVTLQIIQKFISANHSKIIKYNKVTLLALGQDIERLISKSLAIYQKEKDDKSYLMLRLSIDSYIKLDIFKRQVEVVTLLLELLNERNEEAPLLALCEVILKDNQYKVLFDKANLIILLNLEKNFLTNPKDNQTTFFESLKKYLVNNKADQWETVASRYYDYLVKANLNNEAENIIVNLNKNFPKEDYFLKVIAIKFELKKCTEVVDLLNNKKDLDKKFLNYKRECHLILAQNSKTNASGFNDYQKSILEFISLSEGSKKNAAIGDYLNALSKSPENSKIFINALEKDYYSNRFEPEVFSNYQNHISTLLENGQYDKAKYFLKDCQTHKSCEKLTLMKNNLENIEKLDSLKNKTLKNLDLKNAEFYKYIALISPEVLLESYIEDNKINQYDISLLFVSSKLSMVDWNNEHFKPVYLAVEKNLTKDEKPVGTINSLTQLNKIKFPEYKGRHHLKDQDIMYLMKKVQNTRKNLLKDLAQLSLNGQKLLLTKALEVETKMGDIIKSSPIPKNLEEAKIAEYEDGLKQLADEFVVQGEVYKKSIVNVDQQITIKNENQVKTNQISKLKIPKDFSEWILDSNISIPDKIKTFVAEKNFYQAIFYADYLLSLSKLTTNEYYLIRSGILLISANERVKSEPMAKYVWDELEQNKQTVILNDWLSRSTSK